MKMENLKSELNHKSSECVKMENELIKVMIFFFLFFHFIDLYFLLLDEQNSRNNLSGCLRRQHLHVGKRLK